jgi:aspartate beta-hydroxylase/beta-hydroxylase
LARIYDKKPNRHPAKESGQVSSNHRTHRQNTGRRFGVFFSILDPGKSIPAHRGPYLRYLRYHLALRVPKNNPPKMRVKDEFYLWEEGKSIVFDDSLEHEVYNKSDETRVVLIVDFLRPMNLPAHALNVAIFKLAPFSEEAREALSQIER